MKVKPDLLVEIEGQEHHKRKRGEEPELVSKDVHLWVYHLEPPLPLSGYRPKNKLYYGIVKSADDTDTFLKHLMEVHRIVQVVRAGGLCACGRLKLTKARLCADCAIREFLQ